MHLTQQFCRVLVNAGPSSGGTDVFTFSGIHSDQTHFLQVYSYRCWFLISRLITIEIKNRAKYHVLTQKGSRSSYKQIYQVVKSVIIGICLLHIAS